MERLLDELQQINNQIDTVNRTLCSYSTAFTLRKSDCPSLAARNKEEVKSILSTIDTVGSNLRTGGYDVGV